MEAGFAGRALQSKAAGAGGGGEEDGWQRGGLGWNQSVFLISNFFLSFSCVTNSVCFTQWPPAGQEGSPRHQTVQENTQLAPGYSRQKKNASIERINSGESQAEACMQP